MTDDEIRQLVRGAIARHLGRRQQPIAVAGSRPPATAVPISFARYPTPARR